MHTNLKGTLIISDLFLFSSTLQKQEGKFFVKLVALSHLLTIIYFIDYTAWNKSG